jgi:hypothetical protein
MNILNTFVKSQNISTKQKEKIFSHNLFLLI